MFVEIGMKIPLIYNSGKFIPVNTLFKISKNYFVNILYRLPKIPATQKKTLHLFILVLILNKLVLFNTR